MERRRGGSDRGRHGSSGRLTLDRFGLAAAVAYGVVVFCSLRFLFHTSVTVALCVAVAAAVVGAVFGP